MSRWSGKADLADHIMMEKAYDRGSYYESDELECFEEFKRKTGGVIYQHHKVKVSEYNQQFVKDHCKEFNFEEHIWQDPDKRYKDGFKETKTYTYTYWGKEYTLKELNKKGVYITIEIHFNTLLDIIPYYPYIVSMCYYDNDKETVYISNESFVDSEFKEHLEYGWISELDYKKDLQKHYLEVCQEYFLKDLDKRTRIIDIKDSLIYAPKDLGNGEYKKHYYLKTEKPIDYMHDIEFVWDDGKIHEHWTSPKMVNTNTIEVSYSDAESFLAKDIKNGTVKIKYVEALVK